MGIKIESMEPEVWDHVRALARDEVSKMNAADATARPVDDPPKPLAAVVSAPKPKAKPKAKPKGKGKAKLSLKGKGRAVKAAVVALAILFAGSGSVLAEEPLGLINPRNLDLTQTNAVWAFSTTITTPRIEATTSVISGAQTFSGDLDINAGLDVDVPTTNTIGIQFTTVTDAAGGEIGLTAGADIDIDASGDDVLIDAADDIDITSADNTSINTTDGSVTLDANGDVNGDVVITAADDITFTAESTTSSCSIDGGGALNLDGTAIGIGDATDTVTVTAAFITQSTVSCSDLNITNVGDVAIDTISADGTTITIDGDTSLELNSDESSLSRDAGDNVIIGNSTGEVTITSDDYDVTLTDATDNVYQVADSSGGLHIDLDLGADDTLTLGNNSQKIVINSSDWDITAAGVISGVGNITSDGTLTVGGDITLENSETIGNGTNGVVNVVGDFQNQGAFNYAGVSVSTDLNTYVLDATPDLVVTAPTTGQVITWTSDTAGDGASTISVDGVADAIKDRAGNATAAGDILEDGMVILIFDGTDWKLIGK